MDLPRPVMLTAWCVGVVAATLPVVPTAAQMTVVPRVVHMEQIACAELLALPSERQDRLLIYFDGYVAGMRRQTTWDERVEGEMIDRAIGSRGLIVIGSVLACFLARAVGAQDQAADNMNILREKARADKKVVVASVLDLTEKEATVFWPVYNAYQSDMVTHYDLLLKLIDAYGKAYNAMSDETATKLLADYLALERAHVALLSSVRPALREGASGQEGRPPVPDREQDAGPRELRAREADSAGQIEETARWSRRESGPVSWRSLS